MDDEADENHQYKWHISPHYNSDYDVLVCDKDDEAWDNIVQIAEHIFDDMIPGDERTITIKLNHVSTD
jgi:hypothetical protein